MTPEQALRAYPLPIYGTGKCEPQTEVVQSAAGVRPMDQWSMEVSWPLDDDVTPERAVQALEAVIVKFNEDVEDAATSVGIDPRTVETSPLALSPLMERPNRYAVYLHARIERTTARS